MEGLECSGECAQCQWQFWLWALRVRAVRALCIMEYVTVVVYMSFVLANHTQDMLLHVCLFLVSIKGRAIYYEINVGRWLGQSSRQMAWLWTKMNHTWVQRWFWEFPLLQCEFDGMQLLCPLLKHVLP